MSKPEVPQVLKYFHPPSAATHADAGTPTRVTFGEVQRQISEFEERLDLGRLLAKSVCPDCGEGTCGVQASGMDTYSVHYECGSWRLVRVTAQQIACGERP